MLTRATDADAAAELVANTLVIITAGTVATGKAFRITTAPTVVGTDPIVWAEWESMLTPIRCATATRRKVSFRRMMRGGLLGFDLGIAWGWSSARDKFVPYTGTAANVAAWLYHGRP